jgi:Ca2+-binding RTX toxin-like protein
MLSLLKPNGELRVGAKFAGDVLTGSSDNNVIWDGDYNDVLKVLDGNDTLFGQNDRRQGC